MPQHKKCKDRSVRVVDYYLFIIFCRFAPRSTLGNGRFACLLGLPRLLIYYSAVELVQQIGRFSFSTFKGTFEKEVKKRFDIFLLPLDSFSHTKTILLNSKIKQGIHLCYTYLTLLLHRMPQLLRVSVSFQYNFL